MNPRLCGCTFIQPGLSLEQGLTEVKRYGFSQADVGLGGTNANFDPVSVAENPLKFAQQTRAAADRLQLRLAECFLLNFGWPINAPADELHRKTCKLFAGACRYAQYAGFSSILVIPGPVHVEIGHAASMELAFTAIHELVHIAGEFGVDVNVEADVDSCIREPAAALRLCQSVPGAGLTLDYSHFICPGIDAERVELLHAHTRHMHIRQAAAGRIACDWADGTIDFVTVIRHLESIGYRGAYCIEYLACDPSPAAARDANRRTVEAAVSIDKLLTQYAHDRHTS